MNCRILFLLLIQHVHTSFHSGLHAQAPFVYNYNIYNGLPSNHIYCSIIDRHGYLWFGTERGVVKYNGYDFKIFNTKDGLAVDDNWQVFEDRSGKLWLGNSTGEMGYLYNDKYYKAVRVDKNTFTEPVDVTKNANSMMFYTQVQSDNWIPRVHYFRSDTLCNVKVSNYIYTKYSGNIVDSANYPSEVKTKILPFLIDSNHIFAIYRANVYRLSLLDSCKKAQYLFSIDTGYFVQNVIDSRYLKTDSCSAFYFIHKPTKIVSFLNLFNGDTTRIDLNDYRDSGFVEYVVPGYPKNKFYIISSSRVYEFAYGHGVRLNQIFEIKDLFGTIPITGKKLRHIKIDSNWGIFLGTTTNGFSNLFNIKNHFSATDSKEVQNYVSVGCQPDQFISYWNEETRLLCIKRKEVKKYFKLNNISIVRNVIEFAKDSFLVLGNNLLYLIFQTGKTYLPDDKVSRFVGSAAKSLNSKEFLVAINTRLITLNKTFTEIKYIVEKKYKKIAHDSLRGCFYAYMQDKMFTYYPNSTNGSNLSAGKSFFYNYGVEKIDKIEADNKYGNLFFKGGDRLSMYNKEQNKYTCLLENVNLEDAGILIYRNVLVVYGSFGLAFLKINGKMNVSEPLLYRNVKKINYNSVANCNASWGKLFMNTDKGALEVSFPTDSEFVSKSEIPAFEQVKFLYKYHDSIVNFRSGDTVFFGQTDRKFQFDVINPIGCGKLKYEYRFASDSEWHKLNANELSIHYSLAPGSYFIYQGLR